MLLRDCSSIVLYGAVGSNAAHLTVSLDLCSNGETYEAGLKALEGCGVDSESPSRVLDKYEGVSGRNKREHPSLRGQWS